MALQAKLAEAIDTVLATVTTAPDVSVSERALTELALEFANDCVLRGALLHVPEVNLPWALAAPDGRRPPDANLVRVDVKGEPAFALQRSQLRSDLHAIVSRRLSKARREHTAKRAQQIVLTPVYSLEGRTLAVRYHHLPKNLAAVLAHVLMLLLDQDKLGAELRQCQLEDCEAFYLTGDRDKRSARYCTEEHRQEARRRSGALRQEKFRREHGLVSKHK